MTEREILQLLLEKVTNLEGGQVRLEEGQARLEGRQTKLEEGQARLEGRQIKLEESQARLEERQIKLEEGQARLEERQIKLEEGQTRLESDLQELKQMTKSIFDQTAELTEFRTDMKTSFSDLNIKVDNIAEDLTLVEVITAKNMGDIAKLKLAI